MKETFHQNQDANSKIIKNEVLGINVQLDEISNSLTNMTDKIESVKDTFTEAMQQSRAAEEGAVVKVKEIDVDDL